MLNIGNAERGRRLIFSLHHRGVEVSTPMLKGRNFFAVTRASITFLYLGLKSNIHIIGGIYEGSRMDHAHANYKTINLNLELVDGLSLSNTCRTHVQY